MNWTTTWLGLALFAGLIPAAHSSGQSADGNGLSGSGGAVLVELFTSEGCSSCPPADELLRQLNGRRSQSGALIVGLSEHVTYWNSGGWKDPYSGAVYTDRQDAYRERFGIDSVYTPQAVINGQAQVVGSNRRAVLNAIDTAGPNSALDVHIVSATIAGNSLTVTYSVTGDSNGPKADIFAVVAADGAASKVLRGENAGQTLAHAAVARSLERVATVRGAAEEKTVRATMPAGLVPSPSLHLVLFAQVSGMGKVLSVATVPLK